MQCYVYGGDLLCEECGRDVVEVLRHRGVLSPCFPAERVYDSAECPKGPFPVEEADTPQHCAACHVFLENPLTAAGLDYVRAAIMEKRSRVDDVVNVWAKFYILDMCGGASGS